VVGAEAVLVTGASGGLGGAVTEALAAPGTRLALHAHRHPDAAGARALAARNAGAEAEVFTADLETPGGASALAKAVRDWAGGPPDGIVHAAGGTRDALLPRLTEADWDRVIAVHLGAAWRLVREAGVAPGGFVVLVGSGAGGHGRAGQAAYAAAKAGLVGLAEALARALGPEGVRVNAVLPGPLDTAMWRALDAGRRRDVLRHNALAAIGRVEEAAAFIASLRRLTATSGQVFDLGSRVPGPW
jgi:3-oxoacyl-[acyl-carrier protein] reductase